MSDELDDQIDRLMPQLTSQFRALARSLVEVGIKLERERVIGLIQSNAPKSHKPPVRDSRPIVTHGTISRPVLGALTELAIAAPEGLSVFDITDHLGGSLTHKQVRASLKNLTNSGEANRASRGRYLPSRAAQPSVGEKPGDESPGSFNVAAE
jgi:hypothetical protein